LAVVWLGIGSPSKVTFAAVAAIFPVLLTTAAAVSTVEARAVLLGRALGASRLQMFTKVLVPFALPQILSGLRVGAGLAVIGVIVGEMLLSVGGIGYMITYYRSTFESGYVYLGIVLGIGLAALVNAAMERLEHRIAWWTQTLGG
jgi:ABC-type nitrate/sulfonate/bicarbonate transport system permease component